MTLAAQFYIEAAIVKGTGAGQPLGLLNAPSKIIVAAEPAQQADTLIYENFWMFQALTPGATGAFWLASPSCKTQLLAANAAVGTGGVSFFPALNQARDITTLLGLPLFYSEHCSKLGDVGDLILVNPAGYLVGMRQEIEISISEHLYFGSDELALRLITRLDGQPVQSQALTLSDGVMQVSDVIVLAAR